jgi:membrane protein DedA with SNARE-associated domain
MFVHAIQKLLEAVGLPLVFFGVGIESMGVPLPGETILVIAAVAAGTGTLVPWQVALVAWAGAVIGDNIGYSLGHHFGERFWLLPGVRRHATRERIDRVEGFFKRRRGWLVVFLARFVAILRIFAGPVAGISRMHWHSFFLANAGGAAIWVAAVTTIGLIVGNNLDRAVKIVERSGYGGLALAVLIAVTLSFLWWRRERRRRQDDSASA